VAIFKQNISQGNAATHFRCGGIFHSYFITHLLMSLQVKEF